MASVRARDRGLFARQIIRNQTGWDPFVSVPDPSRRSVTPKRWKENGMASKSFARGALGMALGLLANGATLGPRASGGAPERAPQSLTVVGFGVVTMVSSATESPPQLILGFQTVQRSFAAGLDTIQKDVAAVTARLEKAG